MKSPSALIILVLSIFVFGFSSASESEKYKIPYSSFNEGGNSRASETYRIENDVLGNAVEGDMASENYRIMPPDFFYVLEPKEIKGLMVAKGAKRYDAVLTWDIEPSADNYNLYRDKISELQHGNSPPYLECAITSVTHTDPEIPFPIDEVFYYLTTGRNNYGESILGRHSSGEARLNEYPCP